MLVDYKFTSVFMLRKRLSEESVRKRYNNYVRSLRNTQYPMLKGITYLDYAGTALPSKALIETFSDELQNQLITNPHSALAEFPTTAQIIINSTRLKVLSLFNASPEHFEVIFVANATAGIKLVADAFSGHEKGFDYFYHRDSHTSLVGVRELAQSSHCFRSDAETEEWLALGHDCSDEHAELLKRPTLFAYPAQSNMNGRRLPLYWSSQFRSSGLSNGKDRYTLLDTAAYLSTTPLDLSNHLNAPDFITMSFYKTYGFPNLGALLVRKFAAHVFDTRKYFGGGTTEMITCEDNEKSFVAKKNNSLSARLEDGTLPAHSILALECAMEVHETMYGGLLEVSRHSAWLAKHMHNRLSSLRHANGQPVCCIYKDRASNYNDSSSQGAVVAFNVMDEYGKWLGTSMVGDLAMSRKIHLRSGSLCNPAGMAQALGLSDAELQEAYRRGRRCGQDTEKVEQPFGMVRASLGASSTLDDVDVLVRFIEEQFVLPKVADSVTPGPHRSLTSSKKVIVNWLTGRVDDSKYYIQRRDKPAS